MLYLSLPIIGTRADVLVTFDSVAYSNFATGARERLLRLAQLGVGMDFEKYDMYISLLALRTRSRYQRTEYLRYKMYHAHAQLLTGLDMFLDCPSWNESVP